MTDEYRAFLVDVGERHKRARRERQLSFSELADLAHIPRITVVYLEAIQHMDSPIWSEDTFIANATMSALGLGVELQWLLTGKGESA